MKIDMKNSAICPADINQLNNVIINITILIIIMNIWLSTESSVKIYFYFEGNC